VIGSPAGRPVHRLLRPPAPAGGRFGPSPWNVRIGRFTLPFAAYQVVARHPQAGLFSPEVSLLILIAWPAATLVTAGVLLTHRDL